MRYKVFFADQDAVEETLNKHAEDGWRLHTMRVVHTSVTEVAFNVVVQVVMEQYIQDHVDRDEQSQAIAGGMREQMSALAEMGPELRRVLQDAFGGDYKPHE